MYAHLFDSRHFIQMMAMTIHLDNVYVFIN